MLCNWNGFQSVLLKKSCFHITSKTSTSNVICEMAFRKLLPLFFHHYDFPSTQLYFDPSYQIFLAVGMVSFISHRLDLPYF